MRPRTRLTTPGGQEPEATGRPIGGPRELYSHGFAVPTEPGFPARWPWISAAFVAALLIIVLVWIFSQVAGVEGQDPSLGEIPSEAAAPDG
ncbi:MAG: hypothetical protein ABR592_14375 [Nitriliruptorales bacterium]